MEILEMDERNSKSVVELYCDPTTWGSEPWNEGFKCEKCEKVYGIEEVSIEIRRRMEIPILNCKCGGELKNYWEREEVRKMVQKAIERGEGVIAKDIEIIGFSFGWYLTQEEVIKDFGQEIAQFFEKRVDFPIFYQADTAVAIDMRGEGIGTELVRQRARRIKSSATFGRTINPIMKRIYEKNGFEEMGVKDKKDSGRSYYWKEL